MKAILVSIYLPFPTGTEITTWKLEGNQIEINFDIPKIFRGTFKGKLLLYNKSGYLGPGTLKGYFLYNSGKAWLWNFFEWDINNAEEIPELIAKIKQGKTLLETAQYRKNPPSDIPPSFRDGYGPSVYRDILNAYKKLFGKPTQALVST